ncbi:MAG: RNA polymerase factor sigma-32, partial [Methyloglobulus sp.]|nr:RNA polymerase factor sigma-32 [Methyloglobulus sp.]
PASYLYQQNDDPAVMLENAEWQGHEQKLLSKALDGLDERSLDIVSSRWLAEEKATLHQLAERHQVSAERIRQLEQNAMKKLRAAVVFEA